MSRFLPTANEAFMNLKNRQTSSCPKILKELMNSGRKDSHWAWWIWPTEMPGMSEPPPSTFVDLTTAQSLIDSAEDTGKYEVDLR